MDGGKEGIMVKKMYQMVALYIYVCVKLFIFSILLSLCISYSFVFMHILDGLLGGGMTAATQ